MQGWRALHKSFVASTDNCGTVGATTWVVNVQQHAWPITLVGAVTDHSIVSLTSPYVLDRYRRLRHQTSRVAKVPTLGPSLSGSRRSRQKQPDGYPPGKGNLCRSYSRSNARWRCSRSVTFRAALSGSRSSLQSMPGDLLAGQSCARTVSINDAGILGMCRPLHLATMPQRIRGEGEGDRGLYCHCRGTE